jgi:predicted AAA+ superfamily ATPase
MEYYPRKIEEKLDKWLRRREVIVIKGPRQSGKTTLLLHLRDKLGGKYVTLEDDEILRALDNAPKEFASRFLEEKILFIDEAQYCKDVGKRIKLIYDLFSDRLKVFLTGSGSFDIKVEVGKHLVGRGVFFELLPLDFEEFLMWNLLNEYLVFGGFPAIVKEKDPEIKKELLKNLVRTYLEKDVFFFLNIRHIEKFRNLLQYLSFNVGSILEVSSIMSEFKMDFKTVESYLTILENTYLIYLVRPFYKNLATELKKARKIYFTDMGLRNAVINNFVQFESRTDKGSLIENFILNELKANLGGEVRYWRTTGKAEVDFILNLDGEVIPVEVKSLGKLRRGFRSFLEAYRPKKAIAFTEDRFEFETIGGTRILYVPHFFI